MAGTNRNLKKDSELDKTDLKILQSLNSHLPAQRKSLSSLLEEEKPRVIGKDGSSHRFKRAELNQIAQIIPEKYHNRVKLPIYIEMAPDYGRGTALIHGYLNCEIVQDVLEIKKEKKDEIIIYRPDINKLRKKLPTTTQYVFYIV